MIGISHVGNIPALICQSRGNLIERIQIGTPGRTQGSRARVPVVARESARDQVILGRGAESLPTLRPAVPEASSSASSLTMKPWLRKVGMTLCFSAAAMGFLSNTAAAATAVSLEPAIAAVQIEHLDEDGESKILADGSCGKIVELSPGQPGHGAHLSIHGLGSNPADMAPLTKNAAAEGKATATFAYNDLKCDHAQNSQALAEGLQGWLARHPGEPITIETHSLGGRLALGAFHHLQSKDEMPGHHIKLNMVAPPLAGFALFNIALPLPSVLARIIPGAAPTRDLASLSTAQTQLDQLRLPANFHTKIYYGNEDALIDYTLSGADRIAENLNANVFYIADQGHYTMVPAVAQRKDSDFSTQKLHYLPSVRPTAGEFANNFSPGG